MANVRCPMCGKPNPEELEECQFCGARLKPVVAPPSGDSETIKPGQDPVKRNTSELEKISLNRGAPIHPGEAPTKKNTGELERALPTWLRTLREGKRPAEGESIPEPSAQEGPPAESKPASASDSSEPLPDWLSGLDKAASEDEEVPDWLAGLRSGKPPESAPTPAAEEQLPSGLDNADWMSRLGGEAQAPASEAPAAANPPAAQQPAFDSSFLPAGADDTAEWLKSLQSAPSDAQVPPAVTPPPQPAGADDTPDWLKSLQSAPSDAQVPPAVTPPPQPVGADDTPDWLKSMQSVPSDAQVPPAFTPPTQPAGAEETPDWLKSLQSAPSDSMAPPAVTPPPQPAGAEETPDWLKSLQSAPSDSMVPPAITPPTQPAGAEETPDWLKSLQSTPSETQLPPAPQGGDNLPEWLSGLPGISAQSAPVLGEPVEPARPESTPDWLDQLKQYSIPMESAAPPAGSEPATPAAPPAGSEPAPDWLSGLGSVPAAPAAPPAGSEPTPDWLSGLGSAPGSGTAAPAFSGEPQSAANRPAGTPSWLSQLQAGANAAQAETQRKGEFEAGPAAPGSPNETGPLPEWLSGIHPSAPLSGGTPALIGENNDNPPGEKGGDAFSMEAPDWLSKLNPEQAAEKSTTATNEDQAAAGNLEAAELPSWVQALRPVESVVESKSAALIDSQVTEQSGPLAGLSGVLPSGPGLGLLRKPPAYSTKLQVSDGQHHYAATLDKLIAGETNPRTLKTTRLASNQWLRWLIAALLVLAVGVPFVFGTNANGAGIAPATSLAAADQGASSRVIDGLPANVPVLVAFDYDPALSGELEAVAAPLLDRLLSKGNPLALISTSPTGPILAEHFLQTTPLVKDYQYQSGNQYINLGYLAGGPAGILYFADSPTQAVTVGMDGQPAWGTGPFQGIQKLSDFAAVIVLTDNADTGRNWVEQAGPRLGATPMLMVISAQAEPMIRPYFDSGQLKGLLAGLSEAKVYEQSNQSLGPTHQFGLDNQYWDSFSVGMLVAELLIAVGVLLSVGFNWRARHKDSGEEA